MKFLLLGKIQGFNSHYLCQVAFGPSASSNLAGGSYGRSKAIPCPALQLLLIKAPRQPRILGSWAPGKVVMDTGTGIH